MPEAARRVGRSPETIRRWIWSGKLRSRKVGNQHLVDADELDALTAPPEGEDEPLVEVDGEWGVWLREVREFHERLRARGVRLPSGGELVRRSRQGH